jgi:hypothetical protein
MSRLSRQGVGRHSVCAASGISDSILYSISTGARRQIRARTERRILAVSQEARADRSLVSARDTWRRINGLIRRGFTKAQIARWLRYKALALQFREDRITARNASRVERMCVLLEAGKLRRDP